MPIKKDHRNRTLIDQLMNIETISLLGNDEVLRSIEKATKIKFTN